MSFFSNFQTDKCPGPISGNPVSGLNEKVCLQAQRVFDACIKQGQSDGMVLTITDPTPANPTYPLTFISARSVTSTGTVTAFQVDRLPDKANCARVQATIDIPVEVIYTDANGVEGKASSSVTVSEDVILFVPQPSIVPYEVQCVVSAVAPEGARSDVRVLRYPACAGIYAGDLCGIFRAAAVPAGEQLRRLLQQVTKAWSVSQKAGNYYRLFCFICAGARRGGYAKVGTGKTLRRVRRGGGGGRAVRMLPRKFCAVRYGKLYHAPCGGKLCLRAVKRF